MRVWIWLDKLSQGITHNDIESTYQKGELFCVKSKKNDDVHKYPINHIFCIRESEFEHSHKEEDEIDKRQETLNFIRVALGCSSVITPDCHEEIERILNSVEHNLINGGE